MRRLAFISTALALGLAAGLGAGGAAAKARPKAAAVLPPTLSEASVSTFPSKAYRLSLPRATKLAPGSVTVLENGKPVDGVQLQAPGASRTGAVLVIDASRSMAGKPIAGAMAAARAFERRRGAGQAIGVIAFNDATHTLLDPTSDAASVDAALARTPALATGTHIYDAIGAAATMLRDAAIPAGAIVLLSDGRDVGSSAGRDDAIRAAKGVHARIFSVGLRSSQFDADALAAVAGATGGTFSVASNASQLSAIFDALGYRLSNEYVVRYRSLAGPDTKVRITVRVAGFPGVARARYTTPPLPGAGAATFHPSTWDRVVQSTTAAALVGAACVALIGFAVFLLLHRRDRRFERRLAQFVSLPLEERATARRADVAATLARRSRRFRLANFAWYGRLAEDCEIAGIRMLPSTIVGLTILGGVLVGIVAAAWLGTAWALLIGLLAPLVPRALVARALRGVRKAFADQLPENLDVLGSALRTGHSFVGALSVAVEDAAEPSRSEFRRAIADEQLGIPLEDALRIVSRRMQNRDLIQVALVARLQREAGTNAAEVLEQVSTNVRNRMEIHRLIRTLTAQGRMARWIVSLLPVFLFGAIFLLNRHYLSPLWTHAVGVVAMCLAGVMIVAGSLVIKRIIEIEV